MNGDHRQVRTRTARRGIAVAGAALACLGLAAWLLTGGGRGGGNGGSGSTGATLAAGTAVTATAGSPRTAPATTTSAAPTTPAATADPSSTTSAGAAHTGPCESPSACGFPSAADTGPRTTHLTAHSGNIEIRRDGEVVNGWDLTGSLDVYADDVTVVDSRIDSANWWAVNLRSGHTGLRVLHSVLTARPGAGPDNGGEDYAVSNMGAGSVEVGWDDVSVFANALSLGNGSIHDDYVHDLVPFRNRSGSYAHLDAVISDGGDTLGLRVEHNTLLNPVPVDQGTTSVIGLLPNTGPVADTVVVDNWIAGGSYALYGGGAGASGVVVTGNVFSTQYFGRCGYYGAVAYWNPGGNGNQWSGNRYSDGVPIAPPAAS